MKLKLYSVRDELTQDSSIILTAKNDEELYRQIKMVMCSPDPNNFFNANPKDKRVICIGAIETSTGIITPENVVVLLKGLEEIRLELVDEANAAKSHVIDSALKNGIDKEKATAYLNLLESLDFLGLKTSKEKDLEEKLDRVIKINSKLQRQISKFKEVKTDGRSQA